MGVTKERETVVWPCCLVAVLVQPASELSFKGGPFRDITVGSHSQGDARHRPGKGPRLYLSFLVIEN